LDVWYLSNLLLQLPPHIRHEVLDPIYQDRIIDASRITNI